MNYSEYYMDYNESDDYCENSSLSSRAPPITVIFTLYYLIFGFGVIANGVVLWVLLRYTKLKIMTDIFLLNLVLSDLLLAVTVPFLANSSTSTAACKLGTGVYQLGFYSGTLFVTLMSLDRYLAIVHAVAAMRTRTLRYGCIASTTVWVISVILATPEMVFAGLESDGDESSYCHPFYPEETESFWKKRKNLTENIVALFICLPVMVFCYTKILAVLSRSRNTKRNKAVKLIFTVVCVFVICWVPYNIAVLFKTLQLLEILNTCNAFEVLNSVLAFTEIIALFHCCANPVIYALIGEKFRKTVSKVLSKYFRWKNQSRGAFSSHTTDNETSNTPVRSDY